MKNLQTLSRGNKIKYTKQFMFGKQSEIEATVVLINGNKILLDNGDEIWGVVCGDQTYTIIK